MFKIQYICLLLMLTLTSCDAQSKKRPTKPETPKAFSNKKADTKAPKNANQKENTAFSPTTNTNDDAPPFAEDAHCDLKYTKNWRMIDATDSLIAYSKLAKTGKISVFIIGAPWCGPCCALKRDLIAYGKHNDKIDYYYLSTGKTYDSFKTSDVYFFLRMYDRLKEWPQVIITSPTGSIVKSFCQQDLDKECRKEKLYAAYQVAAEQHTNIDIEQIDFEPCVTASVYAKTTEIVERLIVDLPRFDADKVATTQKK
jgi:hypothetical protein